MRLLLILFPAVALAANGPDVCVFQNPGERMIFSTGESKEQITFDLEERGEDVSRCIWVKLSDIPKDRTDRDQWSFDKQEKKIKIDPKLPKSKSQKLRDQFQVLKSTSSTRDQKIDALIDIEKVRLEP